MSDSSFWAAARIAPTSSSPTALLSFKSNSRANSVCLSMESRKPSPNSALSSKRELGQAQRRLRNHVDRFQPRFGLVLSGTDVDADATPCAVFGRDLDGVLHSGPFFVASVS